MAAGSDRPYVDVLSLTEEDVYLYETIATLEYVGRPVTQREVAAATGIDAGRIGRRLRMLSRRGLLVATDQGGEPAFEPARRDWSAVPGRAR